MPTATTVPLVILILFLWHKTKGNVLSIVLFTSVFDAASALNFGALGVSPPLFSLACCLGVILARGHRPIRFVTGVNRSSLYLVLAFIGYTVATGMVYPLIFEGVLVVHSAAAAPLAWSMSNFAQVCYLTASVLLYFMAISSSRGDLESALDWYVRGCVLSALIAVYQWANAVIHVPYPEAILYSNPSHVVYRAYMINGMWRLNSTFPEASEFAIFTAVAVSLLGWKIVTRPFNMWRGLSLVLMVAMLIMTESSLGYLCLIFIMFFGLLLYSYEVVRRRGIAAAHVASAMILFTVVTVALVLIPGVRQTTVKLVRATLIDKQNSDSYRDRTETHNAALDTLSHTYYLGAGWGSVRASGLLFLLLGNVGVIGLGLFIAFCGSLALPLFQKRQRSVRQREGLYEQSLFAAATMLVGLVVAGAEPVQPILWVLFGVATVGRTPARLGVRMTTGRSSALVHC